MFADPRAFRRLLTALRSGLRGVRSAPFVFGVSVVTMAAGLFLLSAYLLVVQNMRAVLDRFGQDLKVVAFLPLEASGDTDEHARLEGQLAALGGVGSVAFVSRGEALVRMRAELGADAGILDGLAENPLPASFELYLDDGVRDPEAVRRLAARAESLEGVADVRYGQAWVEGYARMIGAAAWLGAALGACLVVMLGAVVGGTIRLSLYSRADEIEIQGLVGAPGFFVRAPFYLEAALQGALGAILALSVLYAVFELGLPVLGAPLEFFLGRLAPTFFGLLEVALLVLLGVVLGVGSAALSLLRLEQAG